jgi:hypothetical protein
MLFATSKSIDPSVSAKKKKTLEPKKEETKARTLLVFVDSIIILIIIFFFFFFFVVVMSKIVFLVEVSIFRKILQLLFVQLSVVENGSSYR